MGHTLFGRFLTDGHDEHTGADRGMYWRGAFVPWKTLVSRGRERARLVQSHQGYLVDPSVGFEGLISFFAAASVPDTFLLWANASTEIGTLREIAPSLYQIENAIREPLDRPLWGILTSGSSGNPKVSVGYADMLEMVALHYDAAVFRTTFGDCPMIGTLATCLPLQFSAAFFMTVLPAIFLGRDLLIFPPHDWRPLCAVAQREHVICQSVPAIAAAGSLSLSESADMSRAALLLAAGYVTQERVRTIRTRLREVVVANIYGTAETGAISIDRAPGRNAHVGRPIAGKPVWLRDKNQQGVGAIATTGPDCRSFHWTPGAGLQWMGPVVCSTDYGHFDEAGHLYLDGRIDAGEKLHGITIYPRNTERHILELDGVVDVRVLVAHEPSGRELLVARVVGRVDESGVRQHCAALPEIQRPGRIECISESTAESAYTAHGKL